MLAIHLGYSRKTGAFSVPSKQHCLGICANVAITASIMHAAYMFYVMAKRLLLPLKVGLPLAFSF